MKNLMMFFLTLAVGLSFGMSPEEFQVLYAMPTKGADECWQLYEAYSKGDGVDKNDSQARKWLLAAHRCGKEGARAELAKLPWRKSLKSKKGIKVENTDDATARVKGEELVRLLMAWRKENHITCLCAEPCGLPKETMKTVRKLISEGADLNVVVAEDGEGTYYTALSLACESVNPELVGMLITAGADPCAGSMAALSACMVAYDAMMPRVKAGQQVKPTQSRKEADRKAKRDRKKSDTWDPTVPVTAQEQNSKAMIGLLLKNGLDVNMWTDWGWSVGSMIVFERSPLTAALLAKSGLKPYAPACPEECVSAAIGASRMDYLMNAGSVKEGASPIYMAVLNMNDAVLKALLDAGADVSAPLNRQGLTVQQFAENQEREMAARQGGAEHMQDRWKRCIRLLKEVK